MKNSILLVLLCNVSMKIYAQQLYVVHENENEIFIYTQELLNDSNISKNDSIFYYNYHYNERYSMSISELKNIKVLDPYNSDRENGLLFYDEAMALDKSKLTNIPSHYSYAYIAIGQKNPFLAKGDIHPVKWKEIDKNTLKIPKTYIEEAINDSPCRTENWEVNKIFESQYNTYDLYAYEITTIDKCWGYYLAFINKKNDEIVWTELFRSNEEKYTNEINPTFREDLHINYDDYYDRMRIGIFMKSKSIAFFGIQSYSIGCEEIFFINDETIELSCINNH
ncbi:hypothetical protein [Myroides odoratus]|uniref:Uncharacterized protein n=1 Tax=Myroides odoratus TaxID=256 RepID=A0A9Q6Z5F6_MYROD|nr:hypothetical protein [Myroides odoratus]EHQ41008.1 hypothetical protein Myrod_0164 [Myroides odoratus DSM 2801]EKB08360.1 hypothetical protein HMPREF9716_01179 [Myroides odoratus CIP 103059]QQT98466.1 hypothetical protein I6I88_09490 [Myroides odoratus]WQD59365.1 hypothetical protein U0010_09485 [Myroides odoratus]STZ32042.1 Uncharacterised protein [Myroides odoratus]